MSQRVSRVLVADRDHREVKRLVAAQRHRAVRILADDDQRIYVDRSTTGREAARRTHRGTGVLERNQFRRSDEAEVLEGTQLVLVHRLARTVSGDRGVARENGRVAEVGVQIHVAEDQEGGFDRLGADQRGSCQNRGRLLGVVLHQGARDLAEQLRGQLAINRGQRGAGTAVEAVGVGTNLRIQLKLANQRHTLSHLRLQRIADVVFVQIRHFVREAVEAAVLLEDGGDVLRDDAFRGRRGAFRQQVGGQLGIDAVRSVAFNRGATRLNQDVRVASRCVVRNPTTIYDGVGNVLRHLLLRAGDLQDFAGDRAGQDLAFPFADPCGLGSHCLCSHLFLLDGFDWNFLLLTAHLAIKVKCFWLRPTGTCANNSEKLSGCQYR